MRYQGTAVHIYEVPAPSDPTMRFNQRMAMIVAAVTLLGLVVFLGFIVFGIVTQRM